jgi:hypothetical protein
MFFVRCTQIQQIRLDISSRHARRQEGCFLPVGVLAVATAGGIVVMPRTYSCGRGLEPKDRLEVELARRVCAGEGGYASNVSFGSKN